MESRTKMNNDNANHKFVGYSLDKRGGNVSSVIENKIQQLIPLNKNDMNATLDKATNQSMLFDKRHEDHLAQQAKRHSHQFMFFDKRHEDHLAQQAKRHSHQFMFFDKREAH